MKVRLTPKPQNRYKLTIEMAFDNAATKSHSVEGFAKDISALMDDEYYPDWLDEELDSNAKDHVTRVEMRVVRL